MTLPAPSECARWFDETFERGAAVMIDPRAEGMLDRDVGRVKTVDALTILRWISRPVGEAARLLALTAGGSEVLLLHLGADALTGAIRLRRLSADDPPAGDQLRALGLAPSEENDEDAVIDQQALAPALAFAVLTPEEAPGEDRERPPLPDPDALPLDIYASAFIGLATEFGAPLESVWHHMWELSGVRWCLLNADLDVEDVDRIPYRQALPTGDFLRALEACNQAGLAFLDLPAYVMTSPGKGHAIHIDRIDGQDVVYHDPWPGRSLLAAGNNTLCVAARPWEGEGRRWCVPAKEFGRIAYAALVEPAVWLPLCGVTTDVRYAELSVADFFTFFHVTETGRGRDDAGLVLIGLEPGHWQEHIDLVVSVDEVDAVRSGTLMVDRSWLTAPETAPFASDLLASFVGALVTEADADEAQLLREALRSVSRDELREVLAAGPPHLLNQFRMVAMTVAGAAVEGRATLPCSTLRVFNGKQEERERLVVTVSRPRHEVGVLYEDRKSGYFMDDYREYLWQKAYADLQRRGLLPGAEAPGPESSPTGGRGSGQSSRSYRQGV